MKKELKFNPKRSYPSDMEFDSDYRKKLNSSENFLQTQISKSDSIPSYYINDIKEMISSIEIGIKDSFSNNPNLSYDELEEGIFNLINKYLISSNTPKRSDLFFFKTIEMILKNPNIITTIISTNKSEEYADFHNNPVSSYSSNIIDNCKPLLKDALYNIQDIIPDDMKQRIKDNKLSSSDKSFIQNELCKFLKHYYDLQYDNIIKNGYIKRIVNIATVLDFCGELPRNNSTNNFRMSYLGLDFLNFNYLESSDSIKKPCITYLMDPNFLKSLSTDELIALSAFYSNRLAKTVRTYNHVLYILEKTNTLKNYYENHNYKFNVSDQTLKNLIIQHSILRKTAEEYLNNRAKNKTDTKTYSEFFIYENLQNPTIKKALNKYGTIYDREFDPILPNCKNDLLTDLETVISLESSTTFTYSMKHHSLESLLLMLIDKNKERNWGIILDKTNSIKLNYDNDDKILIGVDMKEFNMPMKLHCSAEEIKNFIFNYTGKNTIPVYRGNSDLLIDNTYYTTQILMKLSKDQRKALHKTSESLSSNNKNYNFVKHIQWMSHPNRVPDSIEPKKHLYDLVTKKIINERDNTEK